MAVCRGEQGHDSTEVWLAGDEGACLFPGSWDWVSLRAVRTGPGIFWLAGRGKGSTPQLSVSP